MSAEDNLRIAKAIIDSYNQHDLSFYDTYWEDEEAASSTKAYQKDIWIVAFPDTHMEVTSMTAQGNLVCTESVVRATHMGTLNVWVTEPVAATNKKIEFLLCNVGEYENGKLRRLRNYINPASILRQLGVEDKADWKQFG